MLLTSKSLKTTIILREKSGDPIKTTSFDQKTDKNLSINAKKGPPQRVFRCSGPFGCAVILWGKKVGGSGNGKGQAPAPPATDPPKKSPWTAKAAVQGQVMGGVTPAGCAGRPPGSPPGPGCRRWPTGCAWPGPAWRPGPGPLNGPWSPAAGEGAGDLGWRRRRWAR